jgi:hypothetical protein
MLGSSTHYILSFWERIEVRACLVTDHRTLTLALSRKRARVSIRKGKLKSPIIEDQ